MVDVTGLLMVPGYAPPWYGYLFLAAAWLLNRFGRYTAAAAVTLTMFPAVILSVIASGGSPRDLGSLVYLVPGVLLASILHSARGTALFSAASVATILLALRLVPAASLRGVTTPLALVIITAGLAVVSILHRDRLERDRQAELRDSEERLRLALEAAHMATWDWDVRTGAVRWSEGAEQVFGVPGRRRSRHRRGLSRPGARGRPRGRAAGRASPPWRAGRAATRSGIGWPIARARFVGSRPTAG